MKSPFAIAALQAQTIGRDAAREEHFLTLVTGVETIDCQYASFCLESNLQQLHQVVDCHSILLAGFRHLLSFMSNQYYDKTREWCWLWHVESLTE